MARAVTVRRSVVKAVTYRLLVMTLDFGAIYLFTGELKIAVGFMIASNVYTTLAYVVHERLWARVGWGLEGGPGPSRPG
jgi:uncharacterized membrane protein